MALAWILLSFSQSKEKETKVVKVLKRPKDGPEDDIERITEDNVDFEKSMSSLTYTTLH